MGTAIPPNPGKARPWLLDPNSWGHILLLRTCSATLQHPGWNQQQAPCHTRDAVVAPRADAADVCPQDARKNHLVFSGQREPNAAGMITVTPRSTHVPKHKGFCPEHAARLSPLAARCLRCQSPAREGEPVVFIRGCSPGGPSAASQEKQATGENLNLLMAFSSLASALAAARGQLLLQKMNTSRASCFLPCSAATSQTAWKTL